MKPMPLCLSALLSVGVLVSPACAVDEVPDRTTVRDFMVPSKMQLQDINGDGGISDIDIAMMINKRLIDLFGPTIQVSDLDGDGVISGNDVLVAVSRVVASCFGKSTSDLTAPVNGVDILYVYVSILDGKADADINFDGYKDVQDVLDTFDQFGVTVSAAQLADISSQLFGIIGAIHERGEASFMATEPAPKIHLKGVSDTWPSFPFGEHPSWWQPNHLISISQGLEPHNAATSGRWPPNHMQQASATWPAPPGPTPTHWLYTSVQSPPPPPPTGHAVAVSGTWPAGHAYAESSTWPNTHEPTTSRTYWPGHNLSNSQGQVWPPLHTTDNSGRWLHSMEISSQTWPPNHNRVVSEGWGVGHAVNVSSTYPPSHIAYASNTWPGRLSWPPNHTLAMSNTWGNPASQPWPILPPDHNWFFTVKEIIPFVRWPFAPLPMPTRNQ